MTALEALWLAGAAFVLVRSLGRVLAFQRLVRSAAPAPAELVREVERVAARLGLAAPPVRLLAGIASPSVWCFGRPSLLWPADAAASTPTSRSALIAHELAHVARRDHQVSRLEVPASALLWWNPLFWLIRGRIRHFAELSCDAWAVRAYPVDRRAFAEALIDIQARTRSLAIPHCGLGATDSEYEHFERRLNMIMQGRVSPAAPRGFAAAVLLATALAAPGFSDGAAQGEGDAHAVRPEAVARRVELAARMKQAQELFEHEQYDDALAAYSEIVAGDPQNGAAHGRIGFLLIARGELEQAARHFKQQYKLGDARPTALYNLACTKALAGNEDGALGVLDLAVRHGFRDTALLRQDSDLASVRERAEFTELVHRTEAVADLREQLAGLKANGDTGLVYGVFSELVRLVDADGELLEKLGHMALEAGDHREAAWAFGRQAEVGHRTADACYNAACALALAGHAQDGLAMLARAADEGMAYTAIRGDADLDSLRDDPRFAAIEERIVERGVERSALKRTLAAGDERSVVPELERIASDAERTAEERALAARALGRALISEGRYREALARLEQSADLGHGVEQTAFHMAEALAALGQDEPALRHVEFAVQLGFDDGDAVRAALASNPACSPADGEALAERAAAHAHGRYGKGYGKGHAKGAKQAFQKGHGGAPGKALAGGR